MQKQDQSLNEVQERFGEYEQRMDDNQRSLMTIKDHLQFNERFTRMLTRENQVLRMKLAHKEQLFKSPRHEAGKTNLKDGQTSQDSLRREIHTLHEAQKSHESR
jgi:regulator of replication initiation timing